MMKVASIVVATALALTGAPITSQAAPLDGFVGSFTGSGTILAGANANSHQVRCNFNVSPQGANGVALRGTCSAYVVFSRSISADLVMDGSRVAGTYTGARVGTARLTGTKRGEVINAKINWPAPVFGDTTANMTISSLGSGRFRIVVTDRIGANGPVRATTDLVLERG